MVSWRSFMPIYKRVSSDTDCALVRTQSPLRVGRRMAILLLFCYYLKLFTPKGYFHRHYLTIALSGWQRFLSLEATNISEQLHCSE